MIFSSKEAIDDAIIRTILRADMSGKELISSLETDGFEVSFQAVYKALKFLVTEEILIKRGIVYAINEEWRQSTLEAFKGKESEIKLSQSEKISINLSSLVHLDQYWKNLVLSLQKDYPDDPVFLYNPHEIWIHLNDRRRKSEYAYYASFAEKQIYGFCAFGGSTVHEQSLKKELQNEYLQVSIGNKYFPDAEYPIIFNDYIITTKLSRSLMKKIEECYAETTNIGDLERNLRKIGIEKKKIKLVIERNKEKAKRLRKKMSRDFYIPKELIKKYDLF